MLPTTTHLNMTRMLTIIQLHGIPTDVQFMHHAHGVLQGGWVCDQVYAFGR